MSSTNKMLSVDVLSVSKTAARYTGAECTTNVVQREGRAYSSAETVSARLSRIHANRQLNYYLTQPLGRHHMHDCLAILAQEVESKSTDCGHDSNATPL